MYILQDVCLSILTSAPTAKSTAMTRCIWAYDRKEIDRMLMMKLSKSSLMPAKTNTAERFSFSLKTLAIQMRSDYWISTDTVQIVLTTTFRYVVA